MPNYMETNFSARLARLTGSAHDVKAMSAWMIEHEQYAKTIVNCWLDTVKMEQDSSRILILFYLVNDVLRQVCQGHHTYKVLFADVLEDALSSVVNFVQADDSEKLKRMFGMWASKKVFSAKFMDKLKALASGTVSLDTGSKGTSRKRGEQSTSEGTSIPTDKDERNNLLSGAPSAEELITLLNALDDAPSGDVATRQRIAKYPAELLDAKKILAIEDPAERAKVLADFQELKDIVDKYNERLENEMALRAEVNRRIRAFTDEVRRVARAEGKTHMKMRKKLAEMSLIRKQLQDHFDSLPETAPSNPENPSDVQEEEAS
uniref:CID domain-containing protein n=1 Tax=Trichuris muris TaxID=70415 RepID=A0A5S6Q4W2_TRIMR